MEARTISVTIDRPAAAVYALLAAPETWPRWAEGLGSGLEKRGEEWIADTALGPMKVVFSEPNNYGVLDHTLFPETGPEIYVPLRVVANGTGSEVMLTLFRQPGMTKEKFAEDARWVERDLARLKQLMEA